ncbi:MAG: DNA polymerase I [Anaerolineaceae bacterium]|nr:DNA polymerase I [Anaerolineaceae bacterium]
MPKTLYLIDGHALAYRAYFALMATSARFQLRSGEPTAATYGFTNILLSILDREKPEYLAVAFDTGKTFRNEIFSDYKATRAKMPDELKPQIERIRELVDAFNFPRLEMEGFEADDVLGSIARKAVAKGMGVKIITGDRDLLQLVTNRIIVNLTGGKISEAKDYFPEDVVTKMGVKPEQVVDLKALMGDASDNIPGIRGIGPKTAASLLGKYPTLDDIYENIESISGRTRKLLEGSKDNAYMSYHLAKIVTNLDIDIDLEQARVDNMDIQKVTSLFRKLQFRTLTSRLANLLGNGTVAGSEQLSLFKKEPMKFGIPTAYDIDISIIDDEKKLNDLVNKLKSASKISFDTETTSVDPMQADLVGISLAIEEGAAFYIPVGHKHEKNQLPLQTVINALRAPFADPTIKKIGHNLKYDCLVLRNYGLEITPLSFDTMIAAWVIEPGTHRLGLKKLAEVELNVRMTHIEELIGKGKNQLTMDAVAIEDTAPYAGADAEIPLRLEKILAERLAENQLSNIFKSIEMPLVPVLINMEFTGIAVDEGFFKAFSNELSLRIEKITKEIYKIAGYTFNLNSTQQLSKVLFDTLGLTPPDSRKKTKSGNYSTAASVLEEMRDQHIVVELLLEYRELSKLVSTYLDALPKQINPKTGRVHTSFNQTGSVTGRLASSNPNLQNIPTRTVLGHRVRKGFVAGPGNVLLSVDYSQIELRIVAHMANDTAMLDTFRAHKDIHAKTASAIYNVPLEDVTKNQRRHAKAINFGLIYGMSAFGLTRSTNLTLAEAENFVKAYFQEFPGVKTYLDGIRRSAAETGYVETLLGRKRYFPQLKNPATAQVRSRAEREAINAPIQGTAADILKIAMIRLPDAINKSKLHAKMLVQVHDELLLECPEDELKKTIRVVREIMENAFKLSIPLETDVAWGKNWGDLKDVD